MQSPAALAGRPARQCLAAHAAAGGPLAATVQPLPAIAAAPAPRHGGVLAQHQHQPPAWPGWRQVQRPRLLPLQAKGNQKNEGMYFEYEAVDPEAFVVAAEEQGTWVRRPEAGGQKGGGVARPGGR